MVPKPRPYISFRERLALFGSTSVQGTSVSLPLSFVISVCLQAHYQSVALLYCGLCGGASICYVYIASIAQTG